MDPMPDGWQEADRQFFAAIRVETRGRGLYEVTGEAAGILAAHGARDGLLTLFIRHTSASLLIGENASPEVEDDLLDALDRLAPETAPWRHASEGPDDMPAHVKTALTGTSLAVPVGGGRLLLGTWQGLYVAEHRARPHRRELALHFIGSGNG